MERGRIQWLGRDPNFDCTIRVANLDLRDAGTWVCEIGSSTKESFQVQTKEFVIDIESKFVYIFEKVNKQTVVVICRLFSFFVYIFFKNFIFIFVMFVFRCFSFVNKVCLHYDNKDLRFLWTKSPVK